MANTVITPNMSLVVPVTGVDPGPDYANNVNASLTIIDGHTHAAGSGVQITPAAININANLSFNSYVPYNLGALTLLGVSQPSTAQTIWIDTSGNLNYTNGSGTNVPITNGTSVIATSSGISNGSALASFVSGVLTVVQNTTGSVPGNISVGSVLLALNTAGSPTLTLLPPSSLSSGSYQLTLPTIPAQTNVMTLDNSGNMGSITYDQVGENMTSVGADAIANSRTRTVNNVVGVGGIAISGTCGVFSTTSTSYTYVTNLSVTLTTSGRPVQVMIMSDTQYTGTATDSTFEAYAIGAAGNVGSSLAFIRNSSTTLNVYAILTGNNQNTPLNLSLFVPASFSLVDYGVSGAPGTYTYQVQVKSEYSNQYTNLNNAQLVAYEL